MPLLKLRGRRTLQEDSPFDVVAYRLPTETYVAYIDQHETIIDVPVVLVKVGVHCGPNEPRCARLLTRKRCPATRSEIRAPRTDWSTTAAGVLKSFTTSVGSSVANTTKVAPSVNTRSGRNSAAMTAAGTSTADRPAGHVVSTRFSKL